jgi:hypothetical protein
MSKRTNRVAAVEPSSEVVSDNELIVEESPEEKKARKAALFAAYEVADADVRAAEAAVETAKQLRSDAVKRVAEGTGSKGPFNYNGKVLSITTHIKAGVGDGPETTTWSFKGSRKEVEVI